MKNKKISTLLFAAVLSSAVMTGCQDEVLVPVEDNTKVEALLSKIEETGTALLKVDGENNTLLVENAELQKAVDELEVSSNTKVQYTVNVLSASNTIFSSNARTAGVAGVPNVSIRLEQGGKSITAATTESGMAVFNDLKPGQANVYVTGSSVNHTDVEYSVFLANGSDDQVTVNAASQIVLFPTSTANATTIQGTAMINLRSDDDTLGRKYAESYAVASLAGKYLSMPNTMGFVNWNTNGTILENSSSDLKKIKYDVAAGRTIYAFPDFPTSAINNGSERGVITRLSYKGAIVSTKVAADGTYSLQVPSSNIGLDIRVEIEKVVADHTRLTNSASSRGESVGSDLSGAGFEDPNSWEKGTGNEMGSVIVEYKNITDRSNASTVTGTGITSVKRRVISEPYVYTATFSADNYNWWIGDYASFSSVYRDARAGATVTQNIYLEPDYRD